MLFLLGKKLWGFTNFHSDCTAGYWRFMSGTILEQKEYVTDICNQMMFQLQDIYDPGKVFHQCSSSSLVILLLVRSAYM